MFTSLPEAERYVLEYTGSHPVPPRTTGRRSTATKHASSTWTRCP
ncbi:hypothetical protein [Streptomyces coelicoflavus]|nr:hypothetical protein [Streptomyces coelicoflavus]